jgi:hypothetical protein
VVEWPPRDYAQQQPQWVQGPYDQRPNFQRSGYPGLDPVPEFRGFPVYNPNLGGFGGYPGLPGFTPPAQLPEGFTPPVGPMRPPGLWPSWLNLPGADETPARFDRAVLVRTSERVWYRPAGESVFVPLPFFDKVREVEAGAGVQVRTMSGAITLMFHDGAALRGHGQAIVELRALSEAVAEFDLHDLHRLWLQGKRRTLRVRLPDTSVLEVGDSQVYLARDGQRVCVRCYGPAPVQVLSPLGRVELVREQEIYLLMSPVPSERVATALRVRGSVRTKTDGRTLAVDGGSDGGAVEWMGARVQLGGNQTATIDALAGTSFPEQAPDASRAPAPRTRSPGPAGSAAGPAQQRQP